MADARGSAVGSKRLVPYLPPFLPDELLFSVLSRLGAHRNLDSKRLAQEIAGRSRACFSADVPSNVEQLAIYAGRDGESLIRDHTLLPFHVSFRTKGEREQIMAAQLSGAIMAHRWSGGMKLTPSRKFLRRCVHCDDASLSEFGFKYWQRRHQLPTSVVCGEHHQVLSETSVPVMSRPSACTTADEAVIGRPVAPIMDRLTMLRFAALANAGYTLLWTPPDDDPMASSSLLRSRAQTLAVVEEYGRGMRISQLALSDLFVERDRAVTLMWPWLTERSPSGVINWIKRILNGIAVTPFCFALMKSFLEFQTSGHEAIQLTEDEWIACRARPRAIDRKRAARSASTEALAAEADLVALQVRAEVPLLRVSQTELKRRSDLLSAASRIRSHPSIRDVLMEASESPGDFRKRKVAHVLTSAREAGRQVGPSALAREAGLNIAVARRLMREWEGDLNP